MKREIGGYFELELSRKEPFPHMEGVCLNSGRNALEYVLISLPNVKRLWIPYFTCEVVLEPLKKLQIPYSFYHVNENLEIQEEISLNVDEYILVTNYFGIKDTYVEKLSVLYNERLIVDNAQAFFCRPICGTYTIYSPRKFVGVPDGGIAVVSDGIEVNNFSIDYSYGRCSHLLKRYDLGASGGYADFKDNSHLLSNQPIKRMSGLTKTLLFNIDFSTVKKHRLENFSYLHRELCDTNLLKIPSLENLTCPMVYPYYTDDVSLRSRLIANKVFVATYWPNVLEWCELDSLEYKLTKNVIPLPIDQRYGRNEMDYILNIIKYEG